MADTLNDLYAIEDELNDAIDDAMYWYWYYGELWERLNDDLEDVLGEIRARERETE